MKSKSINSKIKNFNIIEQSFPVIYDKDTNKFNRDAIDVMLKHKMVKVDYIEKLIDAGKIKVPGINEVLKKYKK